MKTQVYTVLLVLFTLGLSAQETRKIFGKVSDGINPIENVNVSVLDKSVSTITDEKGAYEIEAAVGDKIQFSFTGLRNVTIRVEDVTRVLNPVMIPDVTELEEVEVAASKRRSQKDLEEDFYYNDNIIRTAWGYIDTERAAGNIRTLPQERINAIRLCVLDLLKGQFAGVNVIGSCGQTGGSVIIRGFNSIANNGGAIFDVDGQIFTDVPWWIDPVNIKRLAILSNLATTASYGQIGRGGVVVINTISGNPRTKEVVDRARLRNNFADGLELSAEEVAKNAPSYLKELRSANSFEASKAVFERYHSTYSNSPYFLLDAYTHFMEEYDEEAYADQLISEHFAAYSNNPVLLKALAYT